MYKNIISSVLLALSAAGGFAQTGAIGNALPAGSRAKMELALVGRINQAGMDASRQPSSARSAAAAEQRISVVVRMQPGSSPDILSAYGAEITSSAMGFATVKATAAQLGRMAADARVRHMSLPRKAKLFLNDAHARTGVNRIKSGDGLVQPYTGKGVLALIEDIGFQPAHPMMMRADGTSKVVYFRDEDGNVLTTLGQLQEYESYLNYHGTHTSTILSGSKVTAGGVAYEGVAPGVDMACFAMTLTGLNMSETLVHLADYAYKQTARPKVVSLSIGNMATAATDNDDDILALLDTLGQQMPVCVSAGNSGYEPACVYHVCAAGGEKLLVRACTAAEQDVSGEYPPVSGEYYFSTTTDKPLKVTVLITRYGEVVYRMPVLDKNTDGKYTYLSGLASDADNDEYLHNDTFTEQFGGVLGIASRLNGCGRYVATVTVDRLNMTPYGEYGIAFLIEGEGGQVVKASGDVFNTYLTAADESLEEGAVTDCLSADGNGDAWAMAKSIIPVGAYNSRIYEKDIKVDHEVLDSLATFSSYAHLLDGRTIPYITAPGNNVTSGYNRYNGSERPYLPLIAIDGTEDSLCEEGGTSMATPYVAGTIALWLEADSCLSVSEVKEILASTAVKDRYVTDDIAWGHGRLDSYNGLKEVLSRAATALRPISADKDFLMRQTGKQVDVFVAGETSLAASLYNMGGALVARTAASGGQLTLDASSLPAGVYVLQVQGASTSHSAKIVIK